MVDVKTVSVCVAVSVVVCVVISVVALLSVFLRPGIIAHPTSSEGDFLSFAFLYINISINQSIFVYS